MMRIIQHRAKCIGCFACVEANPERWRMSRTDGKSVLIGGKQKREHFIAVVSDSEAELNRRARENCPVKIIHVLD